METVVRKIGNSVGAIFPKDISPEVGDTYMISKVGDAYILKPKKEDIFKHADDWAGFRDSVTEEDTEWDIMGAEGDEH
ncbi:AbrB/MazE/SpoVT family DNA-binding domain-containing protein [Vagococcus sp. JNUCC 83]